MAAWAVVVSGSAAFAFVVFGFADLAAAGFAVFAAFAGDDFFDADFDAGFSLDSLTGVSGRTGGIERRPRRREPAVCDDS